VSTLTAEPVRRAALAAGASDFLPQPFEAAALLDLIQSHVRGRPPSSSS
jgi:DNA-binding response OmpR family regulator